jgi:hypothetical protein
MEEVIIKKTVKSAKVIVPHTLVQPQELETEKILPLYCVLCKCNIIRGFPILCIHDSYTMLLTNFQIQMHVKSSTA